MIPAAIIQVPKRRAGRKRRVITPPLTLASARFLDTEPGVRLSFDRVISIDNIHALACTVDDPVTTGHHFVAQPGSATLIDPMTVHLHLQVLGPASGDDVSLNVIAVNGIVAAGNGAAWGGVIDLALPFGTAVGLTLVAATYKWDESWVQLTFDRAIDVAAMDVTQIFVMDGTNMNAKYQGNDVPVVVSPTSVKVYLTGIDEYDGASDLLDATGSSGIVSVYDVGTWAGCTDVVLPFP